MFVFSSDEALGLIFVPLFVYALWINFLKVSKKRYELFFLDFAISSVIWSLIYSFILGNGYIGNDESFVCLTIANQFFFSAIEMAGISIAFPLAIGSALTLGTILTSLIDTNKSMTLRSSLMIGGGVASAICAVICISLAYYYRDRNKSDENKNNEINLDQDNTINNTNTNENQVKRSIIYGIVYGTFACAWSPLSALGFAEEDINSKYQTINAYSGLFIFTLGQAVASIFTSLYVFKHPLTINSEPLEFLKDYFVLDKFHLYGFFAGGFWGFGQLIYFLATTGKAKLSFTLAFAITQCNPLVASLVSIFWHKDFKNANSKSWIFLGFMFVMYVCAILLLAFS